MREAASLKVKLGHWFEAQAVGWGVWAIPALLPLVLAAAAVGAR